MRWGLSLSKQKKGTEIVGDGRVDEQLLWEQMNSCFDPEIPVSIVELGLIYECKVETLEEGGNRVNVTHDTYSSGLWNG